MADDKVWIKKHNVMKIEKTVMKQLIRDGVISIFLYALPIALMFLYYYVKGERPWKEQPGKAVSVNQNK